MKKIYLHVGPHKTGSTLLQQFAKNNKEIMRSHGIFYVHNTRLLPHWDIKKYIADGFSLLKGDFINFLEKEVVSKKEFGNILVSYEGFSGAIGKEKNIYPFSDVILKNISDAASEMGYDLHVIFVIKRQDNFIESMALQNVQSGRLVPYDKFIASTPCLSSINWLEVLVGLEKIVGRSKLSVMVFEEIKKSAESFITKFFRIIAEDFKIISYEPGFQNPSMSGIAYEFSLEAFKYIPDVKSRKELIRFLQQKFPASKYGKLTIFSDQERKEIISASSESNKLLFSRYNMDCEIYKEFYTS